MVYLRLAKIDNIRQGSWQLIELNLCGLMLLEGDNWLNQAFDVALIGLGN